MNPNDPNVALIEIVAERLGDDLRENLVFVGGNDFLFSHDLGDLLAVVDGRDALLEECRISASELRGYLADRFRALLALPAFIDALPGHLPGDAASQERLPELVAKLHEIAGLHLP
jgi:hypothetical protein